MLTRQLAQRMIRLLFLLGVVASVDGFSEHLEAAEEEHQFDDRTLLDVFGEQAKEVLTKQVIPDTDEECRWDWRHARCEPNCDCALDFKWGDYHLGRACRKRAKSQAPAKCDIPPNNPYAKLVDIAIQQSKVLGEVAKEHSIIMGKKAKQRIDMARTSICAEVPLDCNPTGEVYQRSLREKLVCSHIPECNDDFLEPRKEVLDLSKASVAEWSWT